MDTPGLNDIYNYLRLSDRIGTAGRPTIEQLPAIKAAGFEVVINLLPDNDEGVAEERAAVMAMGLAYVQIPVFWNEPQPCDLESFFAAMAEHSGQRIFVHCAANMRVSAFMYLYRVLCEQTAPEAAVGHMHHIWVPNPIWQRFIERALGQFAGRSPNLPVAE